MSVTHCAEEGDCTHLCKGVPAVGGLLLCVLLVDDVPARGHCPEQQRLLHQLSLGGQEVSDDRHHLAVLDDGSVSIHIELQVPLQSAAFLHVPFTNRDQHTPTPSIFHLLHQSGNLLPHWQVDLAHPHPQTSNVSGSSKGFLKAKHTCSVFSSAFGTNYIKHFLKFNQTLSQDSESRDRELHHVCKYWMWHLSSL